MFYLHKRFVAAVLAAGLMCLAAGGIAEERGIPWTTGEPPAPDIYARTAETLENLQRNSDMGLEMLGRYEGPEKEERSESSPEDSPQGSAGAKSPPERRGPEKDSALRIRGAGQRGHLWDIQRRQSGDRVLPPVSV